VRTALIVAAGLLGVWIFGGRLVSLLIDRLGTVSRQPQPVGPLSFDGMGLRVGETWITAELGSQNEVEYRQGNDSFRLGVKSADSDEVAMDEGDEVSYVTSRSALSWPTPFVMNFMTGAASSWRRHTYYRLRWKKRSGAKLELVFRYEQWYYGGQGWMAGRMVNGDSTGLIETRITRHSR